LPGHVNHLLSGGYKLRTKTCVLVALLLTWTAVTAAENRIRVIVFPLNGIGQISALAWLGEGIAVSISKQLKSRRVKTMERDRRAELTGSLDLPAGEQLSQGSMIRIAQEASADLAVMGAWEGTENKLRISVRALDLKSLKLTGEMSANGSLSSLPQMENELAWLLLTNTGIEKSLSREQFQHRMRKIPNAAYSQYIQSLGASGEDERMRLLLRAVAEYRDFPEAQLLLANLYFHHGDCSSAMAHLDPQSGGSDAGWEGAFIRGNCYIREQNAGEAIQAFLSVLNLSHSAEILNNLGVAYLKQGDNFEGLNTLMEAKALAQNDPIVLLNLSIAQYLEGNGMAAYNALLEAMKSHPEDGMLQLMLGFLLQKQGEDEKAGVALGKAKSLGINVEKLLLEDPKSWLRIYSNWSPPVNY
jgi:Flp pilus assembly protein TadD